MQRFWLGITSRFKQRVTELRRAAELQPTHRKLNGASLRRGSSLHTLHTVQRAQLQCGPTHPLSSRCISCSLRLPVVPLPRVPAWRPASPTSAASSPVPISVTVPPSVAAVVFAHRADASLRSYTTPPRGCASNHPHDALKLNRSYYKTALRGSAWSHTLNPIYLPSTA